MSPYINFFSNCDYFFYPALKLSNQGRPSGGVLVLVKKSVTSMFDVNAIKHTFKNIVCIKLNMSHLSKNLKDIFIVSTYLPPYASPFYDHFDVDNGFSILNDFFSYLYAKFSNFDIILCGDLNARIKDIQPITECNDFSRYLDNSEHSSDTFFTNIVHANYSRQSRDTVLNFYGKLLYEFCINFDFLIFNGYSKGDERGDFTFISPNGQSVIDYFIVTQALVNNNNCEMSVVCDVTSWHQPIVFSIKIDVCSHDLVDQTCHNTYSKIVWDESKSDEFCSNINNALSENVLQSLVDNIQNNVNLSVNTLSSLFMKSADCMKKHISKSRSLISIKNNWFDKDCFTIKRELKRVLKEFCSNPTNEYRYIYVLKRNEYKSLLKFKKYMFSVNKLNTLQFLSDKNSSMFWTEIKSILCKNKASVNSICTNQWYAYFKNVFQFEVTMPHICNEDVFIYVDSLPDLEQLNADIQEQEVITTINSLKTSKSPGIDNILNEMLLLSKDKIYFLLTKIFSHLFLTHSFVDDWQKTLITPILKSGNSELCSNYRPISLTSLLSKVYTSLLNKRLTNYVEKLNIIPEEQAAFRKDYSTVDHIFTLYTLIMKQFQMNRKLYVAFIDYRKCFDSVRREALFHVLRSYGISGNFLKAIEALYSHVFSAVKCNGKHTDFFECPIGLKQGCILSPLLFNIFITYVSKYLNTHGLHGLQLIPNENILHHLFYADDNCIFSTTPRGLQSKLDLIYNLSEKLGLEVNLDKTKIIVFRKGGFLGKHEKWYYNSKPVEVVNSYNYLGITFTTKLSFVNTLMPLIAKAKKSVNEILHAFKNLSCSNLNLFTKLFDSKVYPTLSYSCELWGTFGIEEVERVHLFALKRFLNV